MTYPEYIAHIDAAWTAAQQHEDVAETQILAAILFRLVQPPKVALRYLTELVEKTADSAIRSRYEQAITDIQQCEKEEPMPKRSPEGEVMRADGPVSAEDLAQLACTLYQQTAPTFGLPDSTPWEALSEAQQQCAIAVSRRLLRRVEARVRYILHDGYTGPFVGDESEETDAVH